MYNESEFLLSLSLSPASQDTSTKTDCSKKGVDMYVKFSLAHTLRMNIEPDPNRQVLLVRL